MPPARFEDFWELVGAALRPGGRALLLDSRRYSLYRWPDEQAPPVSDWVATRELNDGRRFDIVKIFYDPSDLGERLDRLGWSGRVSETERFFLWGDVRRKGDGTA